MVDYWCIGCRQHWDDLGNYKDTGFSPATKLCPSCALEDAKQIRSEVRLFLSDQEKKDIIWALSMAAQTYDRKLTWEVNKPLAMRLFKLGDELKAQMKKNEV